MTSFLSFQYYTGSLFFLGRIVPFHSTIWMALPLASFSALLLLYLYHHYLAPHTLGTGTFLCSGFLSLVLVGLSVFCFSQFMHVCVLPQLPAWVFALVFITLCLFGGSKSLGVLERFSALTGWVVVFLLLLATLSGMMKIRPHHGATRFSFRDYMEIPTTTFTLLFVFLFFLYFAQGFVLHTSISGNKKAPWSYLSTARGQFYSTLLVSFTYLITVLALGPFVFETLTYPIYYPAGLSFTAEYLDRSEIILLSVFCITEFIKCSVLVNHLKTIFSTYIVFSDNPPENNPKSFSGHTKRIKYR